MDEIITISSAFNTEVYFSKKFIDDLQADIKYLQEENEKIKNTPRLELDTSYVREKELECVKYKQVLEKIREITNFLKNEESNGLSLIQVHQYIDEMQTKINEVLK